MTNKEAITFLREWRSEEYMSDLLVEAIDRAIDALKFDLEYKQVCANDVIVVYKKRQEEQHEES